MKQEEHNSQAVYFKSLTIEGINCFKSEQTIDLTDGNDNPAMWTVILGNNNTGKTTLLRCLALLKIDRTLKSHSISINKSFENFLEEYKDKVSQEELEKYRLLYENQSKKTQKKALKIQEEEHFYSPAGDLYKYFPTQFNSNTKSSILCTFNDVIQPKNSPWGYPIFKNGFGEIANLRNIALRFFEIDAYGTQRKEGKGNFLGYKLEDRTESLFKDEVESIINAEEWFLGADYNALKGGEKFSKNLEQIKSTLISILPDIKDIEINEDGERRVQFITNGGEKVLVNQLGSGYQSLVTWVVDLAKRMFDRYPNSANPLAEPAIVLVDEIDLHLHPEWQRKIVAFLRGKFPKTQFIVTAHSPLVIQSADDINVVVLQKNEETDEVNIYQPKETNFQGWTVEEILSDLMQMGDNIYSDEYLKWMKQFDTALDTDNYKEAKEAYDELSKIVYSSATLKMLRIQMSSLMPENNG